jgi:hypothetical protein
MPPETIALTLSSNVAIVGKRPNNCCDTLLSLTRRQSALKLELKIIGKRKLKGDANNKRELLPLQNSALFRAAIVKGIPPTFSQEFMFLLMLND